MSINSTPPNWKKDHYLQWQDDEAFRTLANKMWPKRGTNRTKPKKRRR